MDKSSKIDMMEALLYAAAPYAGRQELDDYENADSNIQLSDKARKRILRRLHREKKFRERHETYRPVWEGTKRVAILVLVMLSLSFISVMSVDTIREEVWKIFLEWDEEWIHVWYENTEGTETPNDVISEYREPKNIGDEYEKYVGLKTWYIYTIEYESNDHIISYRQELLKYGDSYTSNEDTEVTKIKINGQQGIMFKYTSHQTTMIGVYWNDDKYAYRISANLSADEVIKIAESVN